MLLQNLLHKSDVVKYELLILCSIQLNERCKNALVYTVNIYI